MLVRLVFRHGWGFDAAFWDGVMALLPDFDCAADDRGYFAERRVADCAGALLIGHSLGVMRSLTESIDSCSGLVAINGFDRFTASGDAQGVAPRVLDRMLSRLERDPVGAVTDFRARCGSEAPVADCDLPRLRDDLLMLRDGDCRSATAVSRFPILSLHGAHDPILHSVMRTTVFERATSRETAPHADAGHLLPLSHPEWCAEHIRAFAERLR